MSHFFLSAAPDPFFDQLLAVGACIIVVYFILIRQQRQPRPKRSKTALTVLANVIAKRPYVGGGGNRSAGAHHITFEIIKDGSQCEFMVEGAVYDSLSEGDSGYLQYQGQEYKDFVRIQSPAKPDSDESAPPLTERACGYCASLIPPTKVKCPGCGANSPVTVARDLS